MAKISDKKEKSGKSLCSWTSGIETCDRSVETKGLCSMHYQREKHRANPSRMHRNCKNYYSKNRIRIILNDARRRARKLRVPFNLDLSDIVVPTHCPVLGIELSTTPSMKTRDSAPSIDRMPAEFGYVQGNIRACRRTWKSNQCPSSRFLPLGDRTSFVD